MKTYLYVYNDFGHKDYLLNTILDEVNMIKGNDIYDVLWKLYMDDKFLSGMLSFNWVRSKLKVYKKEYMKFDSNKISIGDIRTVIQTALSDNDILGVLEGTVLNKVLYIKEIK